MYGALEEAHIVTDDMIATIAADLDEDLGTGTAALVRRPASTNGAGTDLLARRVVALEQGVARQERIFRRLLDLLGGYQPES